MRVLSIYTESFPRRTFFKYYLDSVANQLITRVNSFVVEEKERNQNYCKMKVKSQKQVARTFSIYTENPRLYYLSSEPGNNQLLRLDSSFAIYHPLQKKTRRRERKRGLLQARVNTMRCHLPCMTSVYIGTICGTFIYHFMPR